MKKTIAQVSKAAMVAASAGVILLLLTNSGCTPPAVTEFLEKVEKTKKTYKASEIKNAAVQFIGQTNEGIPASNIIYKLPIFDDEGGGSYIEWIDHMGGPNPKDQDGIGFITGGGFGHWGLFVCTSKRSLEEAQKWKGTLYPWDDGVYFWIER